MEKDGCFDNLLPRLSAGPCLNSHHACLSVYFCSHLCVIVHTYCTCPSLTKSLRFASPFGKPHLLPLDSLAVIHIYAVSLSPRLQGQKYLTSSSMIICARHFQKDHSATYVRFKFLAQSSIISIFTYMFRNTHEALSIFLVTSMNSLKIFCL